MARAVGAAGALGTYYSGYPAWKLANTESTAVRCHSFRTNVVYGLLKYAPSLLRPSPHKLFRWQDRGFDRWVSRHLQAADFIHAMPGQALHTFRRARQRGIHTVLNHATGPVSDWVEIMRPEYERIGWNLEEACPYDANYFSREGEEYALADWHCVASTIVRDQLTARGVESERIWLVPYGAATGEDVFYPPATPVNPSSFRILFAGQIGLRKGIRVLLEALMRCGKREWSVHFAGNRLEETAPDIAAYRGLTPLHFHGAMSQAVLAEQMRASSVLVLSSLEEGFGLVVPQALNCGCPCVVSDRVGAKDLIRHRENGSIYPVRNAAALCEELSWWSEHPNRATENFQWQIGARLLVTESRSALR